MCHFGYVVTDILHGNLLNLRMISFPFIARDLSIDRRSRKFEYTIRCSFKLSNDRRRNKHQIMGTGASKRKVEPYPPIQQWPTVDPLRRWSDTQPFRQTLPPPPSSAYPSTEETRPPKPRNQQPANRSQLRDVKSWPLPPDEDGGRFETDGFTDQERYSLRRAYNEKVSSSDFSA